MANKNDIEFYCDLVKCHVLFFAKNNGERAQKRITRLEITIKTICIWLSWTLVHSIRKKWETSFWTLSPSITTHTHTYRRQIAERRRRPISPTRGRHHIWRQPTILIGWFWLAPCATWFLAGHFDCGAHQVDVLAVHVVHVVLRGAKERNISKIFKDVFEKELMMILLSVVRYYMEI